MSNNPTRKLKRQAGKKADGPAPADFRASIAANAEKFMSVPETQPCIICEKPPGKDSDMRLGILIPGPNVIHRFGGIPGRQRFIPYAICPECLLLSDHESLAEEVLTTYADGLINSAPDEVLDNMLCVGCKGTPDMIHTGDERTIFATCRECRDTRGNLAAMVAEAVLSHDRR